MRKFMTLVLSGVILIGSVFNTSASFAAMTTYTVQDGDVLWEIAAENNVSTDELIAYNNLSNPNVLTVGQALQLPAAELKAKNVILLIGDGMGFGQMELARLLEYGKTGELNMEDMDHTAFVKTNSYSSIVTDSAAAGTAIATGVKTYNEGIGVDQDGNEVDSMADLFKNKGKSIGIISTNTVYDATPATFVSSAALRSDKAEIVRDMLESDWDVLLGGGTKYFSPKKQDGVDMIEKYKENGYDYVTDRDELNAIQDSDKLLGLFSYDYMSYKTDREEVKSNEPTLQEMTAKAIELLSDDEDGFFIMSEGARIDHAAHAADATGVWKELIEFDETVKYCMDWAAENGDTLVIVTADHNTMSVAPSETMDLEAVKAITASPEYMGIQLEKNADETLYTIESIQSVIKEYSGIELNDQDAEELQARLDVELYDYKLGWEIGSVIAHKLGVGAMDWELRKRSETGGHVASWVPIFAEGPGAEDFEGVLDNTEIIDIILDNTK